MIEKKFPLLDISNIRSEMNKLLFVVILILILSFGIGIFKLSISIKSIEERLVDRIDKQERILVPFVPFPMKIGSNSTIPDEVILNFFMDTVSKLEGWNAKNYKNNINTILNERFSYTMKVKIENNLFSSKRLEFIEKNQISSIVYIDKDDSEATWCNALKKICGIIIGERRMMINGNKSWDTKKIGYFFLADLVVKKNEKNGEIDYYTSQITRMILEDNSENPRDLLEKHLKVAREGGAI